MAQMSAITDCSDSLMLNQCEAERGHGAALKALVTSASGGELVVRRHRVSNTGKQTFSSATVNTFQMHPCRQQ